MVPYLTTQELASLIGVTPRTISNLLTKSPESLPPAYRFGDTRRVLFKADEVEGFLRRYEPKEQCSKN